jgi:protein-S-isoprenylcysteine O-methyltransferase Ste14
MSLHESMIKSGHTLFRFRSYLPLLIIGPLLVAMKESVNIEDLLGDDIEDLCVFFCFFISLAGLYIRIKTIGHIPTGTSGRNTQSQRADHLNTTGMYSIVRNPLYLGNFVLIMGVLLSIKVWWLVLLGALAFFVYMERIILAEEKFLSEKYGDDYIDWNKRTPVILPNFKLWQKPLLPFSWKMVLRREYPGLIAVAAAFYITEAITDVVFEKEPLAEWFFEDIAWSIMMGTFLIIGLALRHLKKHTSLLKVEDR